MSVLTQRTSKPNNYANSQTTQNKIETAPRIVESASVDENGKTNWKDYFGSSDFQEYSQKGNAIQNPTYEGANRGMSVGNWRPFADQVNNMVTYSRANANKIALGAANSSNVVGNLKYSDMTDDEVNMYNYLLAKENEGLLAKGTSQSFLNDIDQTLLQREGKKSGEAIAEMIKGDNIGEKIGGSILGIGTAYGSGFTRGISGIQQIGNKKPVEDKALTYTGQSLRENLQDVGKQTKSGNSMSQAIFDFSSSLGNMAPSIAAGTFLGPVAGAATIGLSSGGSAKKQALEEGKTLGEAKAYGALVGAAEAGLGYLLGGIDAVGGKITKGLSKKASNSILKALEKASPALAKAAAYTGTKLIKANGEFNEEYLQDILDPIFRNIVFDENNKIKIFSEDAVYSGILGALNSLVLGVGGDILTNAGKANDAGVTSPTTPLPSDQTQPLQNVVANPFTNSGLSGKVNFNTNPTTQTNPQQTQPLTATQLKPKVANPFVTSGLSQQGNFNTNTTQPQPSQTPIQTLNPVQTPTQQPTQTTVQQPAPTQTPVQQPTSQPVQTPTTQPVQQPQPVQQNPTNTVAPDPNAQNRNYFVVPVNLSNGKVAYAVSYTENGSSTEIPTGKTFVSKTKANDYIDSVTGNKVLKQKQFDAIQKLIQSSNGISSKINSSNDIYTFEEMHKNGKDAATDFPDSFAKRAISNGTVLVYANEPITNGTTVTLSKEEARKNSTTGKFYVKSLDLKDVAWTSGTEGQVIDINGGKNNGQSKGSKVKKNNGGIYGRDGEVFDITSLPKANQELARFCSPGVREAFTNKIESEQRRGNRIITFSANGTNVNYAISYKPVDESNFNQSTIKANDILDSFNVPHFTFNSNYKFIAESALGLAEKSKDVSRTNGSTLSDCAIAIKENGQHPLNTAYHEMFHFSLSNYPSKAINYANFIISQFKVGTPEFDGFIQGIRNLYKNALGSIPQISDYSAFRFDNSNYLRYSGESGLFNELVAFATGSLFEDFTVANNILTDIKLCKKAAENFFIDVAIASTTNTSSQQNTPVSQKTVPEINSQFNFEDSVKDSYVDDAYSQSQYTTLRFDKARQQATGYTADQYRELFKYKPVSEAESLTAARKFIYDTNGDFIGNSYPQEFAKIADALKGESSWTGVEIDIGHLIEQELMKKAQNSQADTDTYIDWLEKLRKSTTESGRALQASSKWSTRGNLNGASGRSKAWKLINSNPKLSQAAKTALFNKILGLSNKISQNADNNDVLKQIIIDVATERGRLNNLFGGKNSALESIVNKSLNSMTNEQLQQFAYNSVSALAEDSMPRDIGQIVKSVQVLNMLSSPTTATTNIASNTTFYGLDSLSMKAANILDKVISNRTGTRSIANETVLSNQTKDAAIKGMMNSIAEIALGVDMGNDNRYGVSKGTFRANGNMLERIMHKVETASGYALNATDEFYKGAARSTEADIQAAINKGEIKTNDINYAKNMANELALYRTFQNNSKIAAILNTVHDALNIVGIGDSGKRIAGQKVGKFGVGDLVSPFTKIAANLAQVAIDYSPVKAIKGTYEIVKTCADASANPTMQAKAVTDTARGITGTAIAIVFAGLAQAGIIKRADDEDEDVNKLNAAEGRQGTQINLSAFERWIKNGFKGNVEWQYGDQLVDLSRLEPFNFMVNLGLTANENDEDKEAVVSMFTPGVNASAIIDAMADLPVAESIGGLAKDVLKYNKPIGESLTTSVGRTAISSVTPNILASYAKATDDKKRSITSGDTVGEQLTDYAKRRIPGLRETLPTTVDVNGNEQEESGFAASMISPFFPNTYTQSDVSKEMERVRSETGKADFYPTTRSQREVKYTKDGVEHVKRLDYEARQKFQKLNNQTQNREMVKLMKTGYYNEATDEEKAMMLKKCYDYAYGIAKESVLGKDAVDDWILDIKDGKIDLPNYCQYLIEINSIKGDKDANGNTISGSEKAKKLQAINSLDVSNETKDLFFKMAYPKGNYADTGWNQGKANTSSNFWKARGKS